MTPPPPPSDTVHLNALTDEALAWGLPRRQKVVLVMDLVESVRLMAANEAAVVQRWHAFVQHARAQVLPARHGRHVKSLGDGLLAEFDSAPEAVQAAHELHHYFDDSNRSLPPDQQFHLRAGLNAAQIYVDAIDIYGSGVNLAARVASLAGPGETTVTAEVHDLLTAGLDADLEDLGECYLKHIAQPVRVWRVGPVGPAPVIQQGDATPQDLRPTIAVIPFAAQGGEAGHEMLGEALADEVIAALSRTSELHVISRLSTTVFGQRTQPIADIRHHLGANYVLSGTCRSSQTQVALFVELTDTRSGLVVWAEQLRGQVQGIFLDDDDLIARLVAGITSSVMSSELERGRTQALPTLESHTLLLSAVSLMHRLSRADFERAKAMLDHLAERMPRHPLPHAWLAQWHVLKVQQGWAMDRQLQARLALDSTRRALDIRPDCAAAMTAEGFVHVNLLRDPDAGMQSYEQALQINPNDSMAWLLKGTLHAFRDEGAAAVADTGRALNLSPLDPLKYFYDSLAATAALAAQDYKLAHTLALRSLRANRTHTSTLRALIVAQAMLGDTVAARETVAQLHQLEPDFSVSSFLAKSASNMSELGQRCAQTFRLVGVSE